MHKFPAPVPQSSALTALRFLVKAPVGVARWATRTVRSAQAVRFGRADGSPLHLAAGRCVARLVIAALATLRHENLCIMRVKPRRISIPTLPSHRYTDGKWMMWFTAAITLVVLSYTWLIVPLFGVRLWLSLLAVVAVLVVCVWRACQTGDWGLNRSHFFPAFGWTAILTLPALLLIYGAGWAVGTAHVREHPELDFLFLFFWALGQQFALQTVIFREAQACFPGRRAILVAAILFSILHLPNPFLAPVTFAAALVWCWIYEQHPNLIPLAAGHAVSTLVILSSLDRSITGGLRVGYSYLLR